MMFTSHALRLTDRELLDATVRAVRQESLSTVELLSLLAELDARRLYLAQGFSSLFTYCTQALHLSEPAAYSRIAAARASRAFPILLERLADGDITLTTITLLAPHLTSENHEALISAARHKTKRDVEQLVASLYPQPDVPTLVRRLSSHAPPPSRPALLPGPVRVDASAPVAAPAPAGASTLVATRYPKPATAPLAPDRYLLRVTIDAGAHAHLKRAQDLLRHSMPNPDPAAVIGLALAAFVDHLEKKKAATATRPRLGEARAGMKTPSGRSRQVPAAIRREVWARDGARCAFAGPHGRCSETGFLEFHHVRPFAEGGPADTANIELRCRAHNQHEADVCFS